MKYMESTKVATTSTQPLIAKTKTNQLKDINCYDPFEVLRMLEPGTHDVSLLHQHTPAADLPLEFKPSYSIALWAKLGGKSFGRGSFARVATPVVKR